MSLLNDNKTTKDLAEKIVKKEDLEVVMVDDSVVSQKNISPDKDGVNVLDLDAELTKEKAKAGIGDDLEKMKEKKEKLIIGGADSLEEKEEVKIPMQPGLGMVGDADKKAGMAKAPVPKGVQLEQSDEMGGGLGAFSLLPVDEEGILYHDLPRAIRKLLYIFVGGAILILASWYFASDFLSTYMQEANILQTEIRSVNTEKIRYKVTDADLRVNYQYYQLVKNLLYNHVTWSKFFGFLEQFTVPEVYYTNFTVNAVIDDSIIFDAVATNLKSALKQYLVLKRYAGDYCDSVEMTSLTLVTGDEENNEQAVTFNLSFQVNENIFKLKTNEEKN